MATLKPLADPLALVMLGAGTATGILAGHGLVAALGLIGYGLIAIPALIAANRPAPPADPAPGPALGGAYGEAARRLEALAERIDRAIAGAAPVVRACVGDLPPQVRDLVTQCRGLLGKQGDLDRFLSEAEAEDPARDLARLRAAEAGAQDPAVRERWAQARVSAESRLAELARIRTNRERIAADLAEVEARLKQVHSRIVSVDSSDEARLTGLSGELRTSLGDLAQQVAVFDRVLDPVVETPAAESPATGAGHSPPRSRLRA